MISFASGGVLLLGSSDFFWVGGVLVGDCVSGITLGSCDVFSESVAVSVPDEITEMISLFFLMDGQVFL